MIQRLANRREAAATPGEAGPAEPQEPAEKSSAGLKGAGAGSSLTRVQRWANEPATHGQAAAGGCCSLFVRRGAHAAKRPEPQSRCGSRTLGCRSSLRGNAGSWAKACGCTAARGSLSGSPGTGLKAHRNNTPGEAPGCGRKLQRSPPAAVLPGSSATAGFLSGIGTVLVAIQMALAGARRQTAGKQQQQQQSDAAPNDGRGRDRNREHGRQDRQPAPNLGAAHANHNRLRTQRSQA